MNGERVGTWSLPTDGPQPFSYAVSRDCAEAVQLLPPDVVPSVMPGAASGLLPEVEEGQYQQSAKLGPD